MAINFPPQPVFPTGLDTTRTLYLVYNTTESKLASDNQPWSDEIEIVPVAADKPEVWANNGFGTINGELFYYDSVEKNSDGKVSKLRRVARNLGGTQTQFNPVNTSSDFCNRAGTIVRGMVVAEHHNQLINAIYEIEKFVGFNFDTDVTTLDYRIRCLRDVAICEDDFCPIVNFTTSIANTDDCLGINLNFDLEIDGVFTDFRIDFGDGTFTTTDTTGVKQYAPNAIIDPVAVVTSSRCQIIQTPSIRTQSTEPRFGAAVDPPEIPIPEIPDFPAFEFPDVDFLPPDIVQPPNFEPCISLTALDLPNISIGPIYIDIPSTINFGPVSFPSIINFGPVDVPTLINFGPLDIPSTINFGPVDIPSVIVFGPVDIPSVISFGPVDIPSVIVFGPVDIPSVISFGPVDVPSVIEFGPAPSISDIQFGPAPSISDIQFGPAPSISDIEFGPAPSIENIEFSPAPSIEDIQFSPAPSIEDIQFSPAPSIEDIQFAPAPTVSVEWGPTPTISAIVDLNCPSSSPSPTPFTALSQGIDGLEELDDDLEVKIADIGIPSEIKVIAPKMPKVISVEHDLPTSITVNSSIPKEIQILGPEKPLPEVIRLISDVNIPSSIELTATKIPETIELVAKNIPEFITLEVPENFPSSILLDASGIPDTIKVTGVPETITLLHNIPEEIFLKAPDDLEIPLVFKGAPVDLNVKVSLETERGDIKDNDKIQCVAIMPCPSQ